MFGIVIDKDGYKIDFVHFFEDGEIDGYVLHEDESIIQDGWQIANAMGKPKWTGTEWIDEEPPEQIDICEEDRIKTNEELTEELLQAQKIIADLEIESIVNN